MQRWKVRQFNVKRGFTIVELLIVIVVIGILAAITIVAYNGISKSAVEAAMKSDLDTAGSALAFDYKRNATYPATAAAANSGQGLATSGANVLDYQLKPYGYCVAVTNTKTTNTYRMKSSNLKIEAGSCDATVTTLAGSGAPGYKDATGNAAQFSNPDGLALNSAGILYVADQANSRIRTVAPDGTVGTFAGTSTAGFLDGPIATAKFNYPSGLAFDSSGNLYVADGRNNRIRKITPDGTVSTLAGSGAAGYRDGTGTAAQFSGPSDVAVGPSGMVYVADGLNRVRQITPAGVVTTLAGTTATTPVTGFVDGTGPSAQFNNVNSITVDLSGIIYVADTYNNAVRKILPDGTVTTLAGAGPSGYGYAEGSGTSAQFSNIWGVKADANGAVYVADTSNVRIRKVTPSGDTSLYAGSSWGAADGSARAAQFKGPYGIVIDKSGVVYVADYTGNTIRKITP